MDNGCPVDDDRALQAERPLHPAKRRQDYHVFINPPVNCKPNRESDRSRLFPCCCRTVVAVGVFFNLASAEYSSPDTNCYLHGFGHGACCNRT